MNDSTISEFINRRRGRPWQYRLKVKDELLPGKWSQMLIHPTPGYIEVEEGPYSLRQIEWIDINPMELRKEGRLMPLKEVDHTVEIVKLLNDLGIHFLITEGVVRITLTVGSK